MTTPKNGIYFDSSKLPLSRAEYVVWMDGMGLSGYMSRSLHHASNFVFKLQSACAEATTRNPSVRVYPIMDGLYATCASRDEMVSFMRHSYRRLAAEFLSKTSVTTRFLVRSGMSYGPVIHGNREMLGAFAGGPHDRRPTPAHTKALGRVLGASLLGPAMVDAFAAEKKAPPFGVYVTHCAMLTPSVANKGDSGFVGHLWKWWEARDSAQVKRLASAIQGHLEKCSAMPTHLDYPVDASKRHATLAAEYFALRY